MLSDVAAFIDCPDGNQGLNENTTTLILHGQSDSLALDFYRSPSTMFVATPVFANTNFKTTVTYLHT